MSDRTSASIFADLILLLAKEEPTESILRIARGIWKLSDGYDFSWDDFGYDMENELVALGLGRIKTWPEHKRGKGSQWCSNCELAYLDDDGWDREECSRLEIGPKDS